MNSEQVYTISYIYTEHKMKIMLNDISELSMNSTIYQYMNEPFYKWSDKIMNLLYEEIEDYFSVIFIGRKNEAEILYDEANRCPYCTNFSFKEPIINTTLQQRLIQLSNTVKQNTNICPSGIMIHTIFYTQDDLYEDICNEVEKLKIQNTYISVDFRVANISDGYIHKDDDVIFFVGNDINDILYYSQSINHTKYVFVLLNSIKNGFIQAIHNQYVYGYTQETFNQIVYGCFLLFPLADAFKDYTHSLLEKCDTEKIKEQVKKLLALKPIIKVTMPKEIYAGSSEKILVTTVPNSDFIPRLEYEYQVPNIVECSGQRIYGLQEGKVGVRVFEKGDFQLLDEVEVVVKKRNPVTMLTLSDYSVTLGIGDYRELSVQIEPSNADNLDKLKWYSTNENIASVSQQGIVHALDEGRCSIYCSVNQVFSYCEIECYPYAEEITVKEEFGNSPVVMQVNQEVDLGICIYPSNAYDKNLHIVSSNYMVVNVNNKGIIKSINEGEATIYIETVSKRIHKEIDIRVVRFIKPTNAKSTKKGFFKRLFK